MAYDGHLRCIHTATGFHEIAKLPHPDKPGDKCEFLPECVPVVCL
jgi:hypothetical protein